MKDTKHIRWDFHSVAWVVPKGWDFGALGVPRWSKIHVFKHGHVAYQIDEDDEQNRMQVMCNLKVCNLKSLCSSENYCYWKLIHTCN